MSAKITERLVYQAGMARMPISGTFELTPMCNFACKMCYVRKEPQEVAAAGGLKPVSQWLRWAEDAREKGMLYLLITGGEPLTYPGFWELYGELTKMGFVITINSNGSMITEETVLRLAKTPPKKMNITLYGASNESYERLCGVSDGLDRVMKAARLLKEHKIMYQYNCSLTPDNQHELGAILDLARAQGVPVEVASYMFPPVRRDPGMDDSDMRLTAEDAGYCSVENMSRQLNKEQFRAYAKRKMQYETPPVLLKKVESAQKGRPMGCRAGRCSFWLDWQGYLSACGMIDMPKYSLEEESFAQAWEHVVDSTNQILCLAGCVDCKNREMCHTCISSAYCETGDINGRPVYICRMLKAEADACRKKLSEWDNEREQQKETAETEECNKVTEQNG